jgi:hypothetical protein
MNIIPDYPAFAPIALETQNELEPFCRLLPDGVCIFPFAALYLYRNKYHFTISRLRPNSYVLAGVDSHIQTGDGAFFSILGEAPDADVLDALFAHYHAWKSFTTSLYNQFAQTLISRGFQLCDDRDNYDYLYLRTELAALKGKKFHKKKNLVNAFTAAYRVEVKPLSEETAPDALIVLEAWTNSRTDNSSADYTECKEALSRLETLSLDGIVVYADDKPAAFSLGETIAGGKIYCVHFEKGIDSYKGVFQYVNQATAQALPETIEYINREQDVGDEGLRQAKMTYRPAAFVVKYLVLQP